MYVVQRITYSICFEIVNSLVVKRNHFMDTVTLTSREGDFDVKCHTVICPISTLYSQYRGNISSRFSRNSVAFASELLENSGEMFPRCNYIVISLACSNIQTHHNVLPIAKGLIIPIQ